MKKKVCSAILMLTIGVTAAAMLGGCGAKEKEEPLSIMEPIEAEEATASGEAESTGAPEESEETAATDEKDAASAEDEVSDSQESSASTTARKDGERFEDVIILEGMEETVKYEHAVNDGLGIEIDYDYESFTRKSEGDRERFISIYDDAENPVDYLEITHSADSAEITAAAIGEELSKEYDIRKDSFTLKNAGTYISIDASAAKDGSGTPDFLQNVYVVPSGDGCVVATAHYGFESAEGMGRRFSYMMDTLILK